MTDSPTEMLRAFVGLPVKGLLADAIERQLPAIELPGDTELHLSPRNNWHVTLHFFGAETEKTKLKEAWPALKQIIERCDPCEVISQAMVGLPMYHSQAWVIALEPTNSLLSLQQHVCTKLDELGFDIEERPYFPHITLWRPKGRGKTDLPQQDIQLEMATLDEVALYSSCLSSQGSQYDIIESAHLG
ncbi:MAG: RNA 2',3'-cyclic phosphodiesterase [Coxiellaceae bacterium]|nr:RNA 2',3'-cyclic phosphodiesterase [Coxiellaceae bacterium]